ncbi:MAG: GxxExxY protein [Planctomycetota bacterium]
MQAERPRRFNRRDVEPALNALSEQVIGAAIEVHRVLGPGLLESVYEEALCVELTLRGVPFIRQLQVDLAYKGHAVGKGRLDLLVDYQLIVELKAVDALSDVHLAQVLSYLKTTGKQLGLLINFNVAVLKSGIRRVICS